MNRIIRGAFIFLTAALPAISQPQAYTISTVAGGANPYFLPGTGDGGPATSAALGNPTYDVTVDGAKNLYIVAGKLIRKVTPAGIISTVAGGGTALGEFVPATQADLSPLAIVADTAGDLYIADTAFGISRIRKVDTKGIITTVAGGAPCCALGDGGPATAAYLGLPYGLALDAAGNIYVAQVSSQINLIRKIGTDGSINTVAGGGQATGDGGPATSASLAGPVGIAVDAAGDLYIAESQANRIREVAPAGVIITIAGSGAANNSGDGGPAFLAGVDSPWHVAVDTAGDIFVTQIHDARVRLITPDGAINTVAGNGTVGSSGDGGPSTSATVDNPAGIMVGNCGQVYLAQASASIARVRLLTPASPMYSTACPVTYTISGHTISAAQPLPKVQMTLSGSSTGTTQTDANGNFSFPGLVAGGNYTITPALAGYTFVPPNLAFQNLSANQTANFSTTQIYLTTGSGTLSFSAQAGGAAPAAQTISISTSDSSQTPIAISALSAGNWLSVSAKTGTTPQSLSVSVNPGILPANSTPYTGTISVSATGTKAGTVQALSLTVSLLVSSGAAQLTVAPVSLSFSGASNGPTQSAQLQVSSTAALSFSTASAGAAWLSVAPASGTTPGTVSVSANPAGLAAGSYTGTISISAQGAANSPVTVPVTFTVAAPAGLQVTPTTLSFSYLIGATAPAYQTLTISSPNGTQLPFNVAANANGGTWLVAGTNTGSTPATINVFVNPIGLAAGVYNGTLAISTTGSQPLSIPVSLTVASQGSPQLSVDTTPVNLSGFQGGAPTTAQIQVSNSGGGALSFSATLSGGAWLTISPASGTASGGASPVSLTITADPSSLTPGTYQGSVNITGAGSNATVPVTFSVASPSPVILVSQTALSFTAAIGGGAPLAQQLGILNIGNGTMNWTAKASTLSGGNWLLISPASGAVQRPYLDVSLTSVSIDPNVVANLAPGNYYGELQIADTIDPALNTPQVATVVLTVLPAGSDPGPELSPSSLIFTGHAGASLTPQSVTVGIRKAVGDKFLSGYIGVGNVNYSPASTAVQPNQPVPIQVTPDLSGLSPGAINRGTITLQFLDGTARNISLLTVVAPSATANSGLGPQTTSSCSNLNLQWRTPSLSPSPYFTVVQGQAQTLDLQVVDDCGNLIGPGGPQNASVQVTFSNGDAGVTLVHVGNGVWSGTWKPVNPSSGTVTLTANAFNSAGSLVQNGEADPLFGTILPGTAPIVTAGGVLQAASLVGNAPISPGSLLSIYGSNLTNTSQSASQVTIGGVTLPVFYSSRGQLNVQVPYNIPVNATAQLSVQSGNVLSVPQALVVADAQPGVFTLNQQGSGPGVIFHSDGVTLAQGSAPAEVGETIVIYCTGLGAVTPAVAAGVPPPTSPPATTVNPVTVSIAGLNAVVSFSGLAPGFPGLYQVNAVVPDGADMAETANVQVAITVNGKTSPGVTMLRPRPTGAGGLVRSPVK